MNKIQINGVEYPCEMTMGAPLRFKRETGKDWSLVSDTSDVVTLLWCCVVSACNAHKIEFSMSLLDFADQLPLETLEVFASSLNETDDKKKQTEQNPA